MTGPIDTATARYGGACADCGILRDYHPGAWGTATDHPHRPIPDPLVSIARESRASQPADGPEWLRRRSNGELRPKGLDRS